MNKLLATSAVAIAAFSAPAFAADPIVPAPVVPVVDDSSIWDGFYAGLNAGYGWGEGEIDPAAAGFATEEGDIDGWLGGAQVGYNFAFDGVVVGVEADLQAADIVYTATVAGVGTIDLGIESFGTVRARVGFDAGTFMPYLTAGLAYGSLGYEATPAGGGPDITDSEWTWGWTAGAGVEAMVFDNVSLKAEYLYVELSETEFDLGGGVTFGGSANAHTARIGLNYHF